MMSARWHVLLHIAPSSVFDRTIEGVELGTICFFSLFPNLVLSRLAAYVLAFWMFKHQAALRERLTFIQTD